MYEVKDSITYNITIENKTNEDYMIERNTFKTDSEIIEYTLKPTDNTNRIKAKNSKIISLTITYKNKLENPC